MFINPKRAITEGWITGIENEEVQLQPNALDFTLDRLFTANGDDFIISRDPQNPKKELKQMRGMSEIRPVLDRRSGVSLFHIQPHSVYDCLSNMYVKIPEGVAAYLIIRSTFNRNGMFLTSGLYDSGFSGHLGFALHNRSINAKIEPGTRVGQLIFVEASNTGVYAGGFNHDIGTAASHHKE